MRHAAPPPTHGMVQNDKVVLRLVENKHENLVNDNTFSLLNIFLNPVFKYYYLSFGTCVAGINLGAAQWAVVYAPSKHHFPTVSVNILEP